MTENRTNQFTDEQIEAACVAYEYTNELIEELRERAVSDSPAHTLMREAADALEAAAQGAAPQAKSEHEHLLKARALHQTNSGLPSSTVDEGKLTQAIYDELMTDDAVSEVWSNGKVMATARRLAKFAVVEAIGGESR